MFETLVAFGVAGAHAPSRIIEVVGELDEPDVVVGYMPEASRSSSDVRWFTLRGKAGRSPYDLIRQLATVFGGITVVSVAKASGLEVVVRHDVADDGVRTTDTQVRDLAMAIAAHHGIGALDELQIASNTWSYVRAHDGRLFTPAEVDALDWAIAVGDAAETTYVEDDDAGKGRDNF